MRLRKIIAGLQLATVLLMGSGACTASPGELRWAAGNLPPYGWVGSAGPQGYAYELTVLISAKLGRPNDVTFYPWARSVRMARQESDYGTFPLARTAEREKQFIWLISLDRIQYTFFANADSPVDIGDLKTLKRTRVGVLRGSASLGFLVENSFANLVQTPDYKELVHLLVAGVVDVIYGGEPMVNAALQEFGGHSTRYRRGMNLGEAGLYMAVSPTLEAAEVDRWQKAYRELQQDGAVARLRKKYLSPIER